jgi:hypothetical protein
VLEKLQMEVPSIIAILLKNGTANFIFLQEFFTTRTQRTQGKFKAGFAT